MEETGFKWGKKGQVHCMTVEGTPLGTPAQLDLSVPDRRSLTPLSMNQQYPTVAL